ncbi:hypothetical protein OG244_06450 [Streptomyces brevispora]|uniref:hypothetical protein n=1 Tax=Streptomyces brevispora TaxID=887462 RepID=UPI002E30E0D9|nr:hypothetical protein [Streptomyces brevispora]
MKITVRSAAEADLPALLALYGELNPDDAPLPQPGSTGLMSVDSFSGNEEVPCELR